jgi:hypothetical protein
MKKLDDKRNLYDTLSKELERQDKMVADSEKKAAVVGTLSNGMPQPPERLVGNPLLHEISRLKERTQRFTKLVRVNNTDV